MAFSSVHEMIDLCKESGKPLYEVILESDLAESGLTRAESEAEMHRLWAVMQATSDGYCGADRSMSGFAGGDAAKVNAAAARGVLYAGGYFADVMAEALKTAECNACMKRIVAAPTAGSCGVLPAVLLPLQRRGLADEAAVHRALDVLNRGWWRINKCHPLLLCYCVCGVRPLSGENYGWSGWLWEFGGKAVSITYRKIHRSLR